MNTYKFEDYSGTNLITKNINKKVNKYFSEIIELKDVQKFKPDEQHFLILLGGKNVGKSFYAINKMIDVIKRGGRACYMRNTLSEIKAMKPKLLEMLTTALNQELKASDEAITNADKTQVLINFIQAKNYNKLSGNLEGYDILIYDEFNQDLAGNGNIKIQTDFFNILNTAFRKKPIKLIACGNTKTKNNVFFNLFKIKPLELTAPIVCAKVVNEPILFIEYTADAFKKLNGDNADYSIYKKYDELNFNQMFSGLAYEREDKQIINNFDSIKKLFTQTKTAIICNNRLFQVWKYKENEDVLFIEKTNIRITLELLDELKKLKFELYGMRNEDYRNETTFIEPLFKQDIYFIEKLRHYRLFFNNYELFNYYRQQDELPINWYKTITKL